MKVTATTLLLLCFFLGFEGFAILRSPDKDSVKKKSEESSASSISRQSERHATKSASKNIDRLILKQISDSGLNPISGDEVFLRRIYLDIIGRIPNIQESHAFLNSSDPGKREKLIDELLDSYGYVSHQFNYFADLLRIKSKHRKVIGKPYIDFVKDALSQNMPYDQFVRELITSEGPMLEKGNGATGYYLRDLGMPEDNMSNTVRVFLGTRLECAQCHDHPFDRWTQREYFEMLAFTGGMELKSPKKVAFAERMDKLVEANNIDMPRTTRNFVKRAVQPLNYGVSGSGTGLARLPEGFLGDDGSDGEIVKAKTILDDKKLVDPVIPKQKKTKKRKQRKVKGAKSIGSREAFAEWLTSPENSRFAQVIANRLWKKAMGVGLIEPIDVLEDSTAASNPELMNYLTQLFVDLDFNIKEFLRTIYYTQSYQAECVAEDVGDPSLYSFRGPILRRLSAEQIWDSLLGMTVTDIDQRRDNGTPKNLQYFGRNVYDSYEKFQNVSDDEIVEIAKALVEKGPKGLRALTNQFQVEERVYRNELSRKIKDVKRQLNRAQRLRNESDIRYLTSLRNDLIAELTTKKTGNGFLRASELSSPAPAGHLLREFGQSDRMEIENAKLEPSTTQLLALMNGYIEKKIIQNPNTVLVKNAIWQTSSKDKIKAIYLTVLSRLPTDRELKAWTNDVKDGNVQDLVWTLINSNEFLFNK